MTKYINFTSEFEQDVEEEIRMKQQADDTYMKLIRLMMHNQLKDEDCPDDNKKGAVVCFLNKPAMKAKKAVIVDNLQEVIKLQPTHFTQGAYPSFKLKSDKKGVTWGFQKDNLNQINFLMVDFDDLSKTPDEIVRFAKSIGLHVNLIVRSDKGYQAYFIFREALYLNNKRHDWILKSADMIADNLKKAFKNGGFNGVDEGCTNYQICRFPRRHTIEYVDINRVDTYDFYAKWSKKNAETARLPRVDSSHSGLMLIKGNLPGWARALHGYTGFQRGDRNTATYTVALAFRDSDIPFAQAEKELMDWMTPQGLPIDEIQHIVNNAYKGTKHAASDYFEPLIEKYQLDVQKVSKVDWDKLTEKQKKRYWSQVKPAKPREQRQRNHAKEYADDLVKMALENDGKLTGSKSELMGRLGLKKGNNKPLNNALDIIKSRDDITMTTERMGKQIVITISTVDAKKLVSEMQADQKQEQEQKYTEEKMKEDVAISAIGKPNVREYARTRVVKVVGLKGYEALLNDFIMAPEKFLNGDENTLSRIRGAG